MEHPKAWLYLTASVADQVAVLDALAQLAPKYRVPLVLHLCESLSTAEIATVLGIRRGAVEMRLLHTP